jgi:type IX secretion system substrate protein
MGGGTISHVAGIVGGYVAAASGGPAATTALGQIYGIHVSESGDLFCDDGSCSCVRIDMADGNIYLEAGSLSVDGYSGDNLNALLELFSIPGGLWVDGQNNIYVADNMNRRVRKVINVTHQPTFVYGKGIVLNPCGGTSLPLDSMLHITDFDSAQTETFTVVSAPVHGTLAGFPAAALSMGTYSVTEPGGLSYTITGAYTGLDSFRIRVNDGFLSDTITIYISAGAGAITGPDNICTSPAVTYLADPAFQGGTWSVSSAAIAGLTGFGTVTGLSAGAVDLSYSLTNTCGLVSTVKTITVDMTAPASAGTISGPATVCAGAAITLSDATGAGVWTVSNPDAAVTAAGVVTGTLAGNDSVIYTVTNGCGSAVTASEITINPLPDAGTIVSAPGVCIGSTMAVTDAATGGAWSASNTHSTISAAGLVVGVSAGTDTMLYTVVNSCGTATAKQEVVVSDCGVTGVPAASEAPSINIFPNPASSMVNIAWTAMRQGSANVVVTDIMSRVVLTVMLTNNATGSGSMQVDISGLTDGIYFVTISPAGYRFTDKLVVGK